MIKVGAKMGCHRSFRIVGHAQSDSHGETPNSVIKKPGITLSNTSLPNSINKKSIWSNLFFRHICSANETLQSMSKQNQPFQATHSSGVSFLNESVFLN